MAHDNNEPTGMDNKLLLNLNLALYLDLIAVLERAGAVSYRQMAARVLNISVNARGDGDAQLADMLEGIARGFSNHEDGFSVELLKVAGGLREDEALGDIPARPEGL